MTPLKFTVPNTCNRTWKEMLPTEYGRFCGDCTKEVVDFTKFSDDQLQAWFKKINAERVCGRFKSSQLSTPDQTFVKKKYWHSFSKSILVTSCLTFFMNSKADAAGNLLQEQIFIHVNDHLGGSFQHPNEKSADSLLIKGIVEAGHDHAPLAGVWVGIKNGTKSVITNAKGEFALLIPFAKNIDLIFKYLGFETLTQRVDSKQQDQLKIMMEPVGLMGEVVIVNPQPSKTKKINNKQLILAELEKDPLLRRHSTSAVQSSFAKRLWLFLKRPFTKSQ